MHKTLPTFLLAAAAAVAAVVAPLPARADAKDVALEPDRGVNPEQGAHERYQKAVDGAAEALRKNLAQCEKMPPGERAECTREARQLYDTDMAKASDVLQRPR